jgi:hypothetical protein
MPPEQVGSVTAVPVARARLDADFRALESLMLQLDPRREWGGLSRVTTPDWETLYLCREHAEARGRPAAGAF